MFTAFVVTSWSTMYCCVTSLARVQLLKLLQLSHLPCHSLPLPLPQRSRKNTQKQTFRYGDVHVSICEYIVSQKTDPCDFVAQHHKHRFNSNIFVHVMRSSI